MPVSTLAKVHCDRGVRPRSNPLGCCWHTSGGGLVRKAESLGRDPDEYALDYYDDSLGRYPHYLVGREGQVWSLCDELKWSACAAWRPWERRAYRERTSWRGKWADDFENHVVPVTGTFYDWWHRRWGALGGHFQFTSPAGLLEHLRPAEGQGTPNAAYVHVEFVDSKPLTRTQIEAGAALAVDLADRWGWPPWDEDNVAQRDPDTGYPVLPNPRLLTHSDVGPCRRTQRGEGGKGYPFDLLTTQVDWQLVGERLVALDPPSRSAT